MDGGKTANLVYILYLSSLVFGVTGIIGVVMAYVNRDKSKRDWVQSHYKFQIRTFWIGMLLVIIGGATAIFVVGYFVFLFWAIWLIVRSVKGMKFISQQQAHPNPTGWLFA